MTQLVRRDPKELRITVAHTIEHDAWIFHTCTVTTKINGVRPRIFIPLGRKVLDGVFHIIRRTIPAMRTNTFTRIDGHRQTRNRMIIRPRHNGRKVDAGSVPQKRGRGRKSHIAAVAHDIMPGYFAGLLQMTLGICHIINRADHDATVTLCSLSQTRAFCSSQRLLRIQKSA